MSSSIVMGFNFIKILMTLKNNISSLDFYSESQMQISNSQLNIST